MLILQTNKKLFFIELFAEDYWYLLKSFIYSEANFYRRHYPTVRVLSLLKNSLEFKKKLGRKASGIMKDNFKRK